MPVSGYSGRVPNAWRQDPITYAQKYGIDARRRALKLPPIPRYPETKGEARDEIESLQNMIQMSMGRLDRVRDEIEVPSYEPEPYDGERPPWED